MTDYSFRRVTVEDLAMIHQWLETSAVREWWIEADGKPSDPIQAEDLVQPDVAMWLVSFRDRPFAFMQDYDPHAVEGHHFSYLPPRSRGIDQFIGEPDMIGCGHGTSFIRARSDALLASGVPAVGTDPHPGNARAIRAYEKAGFEATKICATPGGGAYLWSAAPLSLHDRYPPGRADRYGRSGRSEAVHPISTLARTATAEWRQRRGRRVGAWA